MEHSLTTALGSLTGYLERGGGSQHNDRLQRVEERFNAIEASQREQREQGTRVEQMLQQILQGQLQQRLPSPDYFDVE